MTEIIPPAFRHVFRYEQQWRVLICLKCHAAVSSQRRRLVRHLYVQHDVSIKEYRPLIDALSIVQCHPPDDRFPRPIDGSPPIDGLSVLTGYRCKACDDCRTRSLDIVRNHVFNKHPTFRSSREDAYAQCLLQQWGPKLGRGYWIVEQTGPPSASLDSSVAPDEPYSVDMNESASPTWEERMAGMETERLERQQRGLLELHPRNRKDDTSPWLLFTKWPEVFEGKDIVFIAETRYLATENPNVLELTRIDKSRLGVLGRAFDRIVSWGLESLATTNWNLCCWLRSPSRSEPNHKPFKLPQNASTVKRYSGYWKQCIYYCVRTALIDKPSRERIYGVRFTVEQLRIITELEGSITDVESS